jgi:hypothetical protein
MPHRLPLDPIMLVISELLPKVHDLQASLSKANVTPAIIDFLSSTPLSHALPQTPPLSPRRFVVSSHLSLSQSLGSLSPPEKKNSFPTLVV